MKVYVKQKQSALLPVLKQREVLGAQVHGVVEFPVTDFEVVVVAGEGVRHQFFGIHFL